MNGADDDLCAGAIGGDVAKVEAALLAGAAVNCRGDGGFTALHFAAQERHVDVARVLLEAGADLEAQNEYGGTPLWVAVMNARDTEGGVVGLLLRAGAFPDAENGSGISARQLAAKIANYDLQRFFE
jgi:ankyrin repeat protein